MAILSDALDGRGRTAGNMLEIAWGGFPMERDAYGFLGIKEDRLPNLKILGRGEAEVPNHQKENKTDKGQEISHILVLTKPGR